MMSKIIYTFIFLTQLVMHTMASDYHNLDGIGEKFSRKIIERRPILKEAITTDLKCLYRIGERRPEYAEAKEFQELYDEKINKIQTDQNFSNFAPQFLTFATLCKEIYEQSTLSKEKAALYILFDEVSDKCWEYSLLLPRRYIPSSLPSDTELRKSEIVKPKDSSSDGTSITSK